MLAGMPLIMMTRAGPGHIAFSADEPGETLAVPLQHNQAVDVVEHRFLVATGNVSYQWENSGDLVHHPERGRHRSTTTRSARPWTGSAAKGGPGLLLLHAPGNTFIRDLRPGERILHPAQRADLEGPDGPDVPALRVPARAATGSARPGGRPRPSWLTLQGPGRVAIQSVFERPEMVGQVRQLLGRDHPVLVTARA